MDKGYFNIDFGRWTLDSTRETLFFDFFRSPKSKVQSLISYIFFFFVFLVKLHAQDVVLPENRFGGGLILGLNASQIDGDASAGYNKITPTAGIRGIINLEGKWQITTDILYSRRGAVTASYEAIIEQNVTTNYLEVPVMLHYQDWQKTTKDGRTFYRVSLGAGICYGKLFSATSNAAFNHAAVVDKFNKDDFAFTGGMQFFFTPHWGLNARFTTSINNLFDPDKYKTDPVASSLSVLRGYFFSFQTMYVF